MSNDLESQIAALQSSLTLERARAEAAEADAEASEKRADEEMTAREMLQGRIVELEREREEWKAADLKFRQEIVTLRQAREEISLDWQKERAARETAEARCAAMREALPKVAAALRIASAWITDQPNPDGDDVLRQDRDRASAGYALAFAALAPDAGSQILSELREVRAALTPYVKNCRYCGGFPTTGTGGDCPTCKPARAALALSPRPAISPEEHAGGKEK